MELSPVQARIEELKSKGKLSFTEQAELTALQAQNDALEQRSALLTKLSDAMASYGGGQNEAKEMHKVTDTKGIKEDVDVIKAYELEIIKLKKGQEGLSKNDKGYKDKQDDIDDLEKR